MVTIVLPWLFALLWLLAISVTLFGATVALLHLRRHPRPIRTEGLEPITILKPLKGVDEGIEDNLETFFNLRYPRFEILLSVAESDDPVIEIARRVMARHPDVEARLSIGAAASGPNPKINNLLHSYQTARYDWVLISDSNTRMSPDHLARLGEQFKDSVAMQTSVVAGVNAQGVGGALESAFLNTFYAKSVLALNAFNHPCVIGKAMLFRKSIVERTGGLKSLEVHMAEDYAAGRRLHQLGFNVQVSRDPIAQHLGRHSFKAFWSRHIRWGRLRKLQTPFGFAFEPIFASLTAGALGASAFHSLLGGSALQFFGIHLLVWFLSDLAVYFQVAESPGWRYPLVWLLREVIHLPLWLHIASGNTILWRGRRLRLVRPHATLPHSHMLDGLHQFLRKPYAQAFHTPIDPIEQITEAYTSINDEVEDPSEFVPLVTDFSNEPKGTRSQES